MKLKSIRDQLLKDIQFLMKVEQSINGCTKITTDNHHALVVSLGRKTLSKVFSIDYYNITAYYHFHIN